jgi:hypothetical protein
MGQCALQTCIGIRLLIEWSRVRVLLGSQISVLAGFIAPADARRAVSGSEPSTSNESCIDAPAVC